MFDGNIVRNPGLFFGTSIAIFESEGKRRDNRMRFVDYPCSSQRFPAYLRHKDKWDEFKGKWLTERQMESIIKENVDYNWYKK